LSGQATTEADGGAAIATTGWGGDGVYGP